MQSADIATPCFVYGCDIGIIFLKLYGRGGYRANLRFVPSGEARGNGGTEFM